MNKILALVILGFSTGIDNFIVSAAIGLSGIKTKHKIRLALTIGAFETLMTILGLFLGNKASGLFGGYASWLGGGLLILAGIYTIYTGKKDDQPSTNKKQLKISSRMFTALSLSIDNLIVGFSLGSQKINITQAAAVLIIISICLSFTGMELGSRVAQKAKQYSEIIGGVVIILVGIAIILKVL